MSQETSSWEQRKFNDFVIASGKRNSDCQDLRSYSVSNERGFVPQNEQFENGGTMAEADKSAYWIVEPGCFAYNPARINVGSIGYQSTGEKVIVSSLYEVFRADSTADDRFLWHWFKSPLLQRQIELYQEGGVRLYYFFDKLLVSEIWMPDIAEQCLIGSYFSRLDNLITLHQRERGKAPFTQSLAWEQRKLSEIVDVCSGRDYKHLDEGPIPVYGTGGYMTSVCDALSHNRDAVGIGRKGTIDKPYLLKAPFWTVDTLFYAIPKPEINLEFVLCSFLNVNWKAKDESTGPPSLSKEAIDETVLSVPDAAEQNHLGGFFTDLDALITLHQ